MIVSVPETVWRSGVAEVSSEIRMPIRARDLPHQILFDAGDALVDPLAADVVQQHFVAGQGANVRDPGSHLAGADHANSFDITHWPKPLGANAANTRGNLLIRSWRGAARDLLHRNKSQVARQFQ